MAELLNESDPQTILRKYGIGEGAIPGPGPGAGPENLTPEPSVQEIMTKYGIGGGKPFAPQETAPAGPPPQTLIAPIPPIPPEVPGQTPEEIVKKYGITGEGVPGVPIPTPAPGITPALAPPAAPGEREGVTGFLGEIGASVAHGVGGLLKMPKAALSVLGIKAAGGLAETGAELQKEYAPSPSLTGGITEHPSLLVNPRWWASTMPSLAVQILPIAIAALGGTAIAPAAGAVAGLAAGGFIGVADAGQRMMDWEKEHDKELPAATKVLIGLGAGTAGALLPGKVLTKLVGAEGIAATEAISKIFTGATGKAIADRAVRATYGGGAMAGFSIIENAFEKFGYNPDRELTQGVLESLILGTAVSGIHSEVGLFRKRMAEKGEAAKTQEQQILSDLNNAYKEAGYDVQTKAGVSPTEIAPDWLEAGRARAQEAIEQARQAKEEPGYAVEAGKIRAEQAMGRPAPEPSIIQPTAPIGVSGTETAIEAGQARAKEAMRRPTALEAIEGGRIRAQETMEQVRGRPAPPIGVAGAETEIAAKPPMVAAEIRIPTPEELGKMTVDEIRALADDLRAKGIDETMFPLKTVPPTEGAPPAKPGYEPAVGEDPVFERLMKMRVLPPGALAAPPVTETMPPAAAILGTPGFTDWIKTGTPTPAPTVEPGAESRADFLKKFGSRQGKPEGLLTGVAPGIDPMATGFQPASEVPGSLPSYARFPVDQLGRDPATFQHKREADLITGVSGTLEGVKWQEARAGELGVFETLDGRFIVAHGHNRLWLAEQNNIPSLKIKVYREADGWNPSRVKREAFLDNLADGKLDALDIGQFLRDTGATEADIKDFINLKSRDAQNGIGLSTLAPRIWDDVYRGVWGTYPDKDSASLGAIVGRGLKDNPAAQESLYQRIIERQNQGKTTTPAELRYMVESGQLALVEADTQQNLFGEETVQKSRMFERASVATYIEDALAKDKTVLAYANREKARLEAVEGTKINEEGNRLIAAQAKEALGVFKKVSKTEGTETYRFLNDFAERLAQAKSEGEENAIKKEALAGLNSALSKDFAALNQKFEGGPQGRGVVAGARPGEPGGEALFSLKEDGTVGLWGGDRPLTKFEKRLNSIISQYPNADPEKVNQALRVLPKSSDREIAALSGMKAGEVSGVVRGTLTALERAELAKRSGIPGAVMLPGMEPGGGLFGEPPRVPAGARQEVTNVPEEGKGPAPAGAPGEPRIRLGGLSQAGEGRARQLADLESRRRENAIGNILHPGEENIWAAGLAPASDVFVDSPEARAVLDTAGKRTDIREVIFIAKNKYFDGALFPEADGKFTLMVSEVTERGTHTQVSGHEFFHLDDKAGDPKAIRLINSIDTTSKAYRAYERQVNGLREEAELPPLDDRSMLSEVAADLSAGMTRVDVFGGEINLHEAFKDLAEGRLALADYRGEEALPAPLEKVMGGKETIRPPTFKLKAGDKIINKETGETGTVRDVRDWKEGNWLEVKWNGKAGVSKARIDYNYPAADAVLPGQRPGATIREMVPAQNAANLRKTLETEKLSFLLDMNKADALAEIAKTRDYWEQVKTPEPGPAHRWLSSLDIAEKTINRYIKDVSADEFAHLRAPEQVVTGKVGKRTLTQEPLFTLKPGEELQDWIDRSNPPTLKQFEFDLAKDDSALWKRLTNPANREIPLYEGERHVGTRAGNVVETKSGKKLVLTPEDVWERVYKPKTTTLPPGTETARAEDLLGTPEKPGPAGTIEKPPGYFAGLGRSVVEKVSAANLSERARVTHQEIIRNNGWFAREIDNKFKILDKYYDIFGKMTREELLAFTDAAETGQPVPENLREPAKIWRQIADGLHFLRANLKEQAAEEARASGKTVPDPETAYWENYFPRLFKNPEQAEIAIQALLKSRGKALTGTEGFEKLRTQLLFSDSVKPKLDTILNEDGTFSVQKTDFYTGAKEIVSTFPDKATADAMVAEKGGLGLEPLDPNYATMMKASVWHQLRFITGKYIENDLTAGGFLTKEPTPGWERLTGDKTIEGYYAHPDVARVLDNFLSSGISNDPLYQFYNGPVSFINHVLVGLSGFHALFSTISSVALGAGANLPRAVGAALTGRFDLSGHYLAEFGKTANIPGQFLMGGKLGREYTTRGTYPGLTEYVDMLEQGGMRNQIKPFSEIIRSFREPKSADITQVARPFADALQDVSGLPRKIVEAISWPIMGQLVPRLKLAAMFRYLKMELDAAEKSGQVFSDRELITLCQDITGKADNIFGQLVMDNLSMRRGLRDSIRLLIGFPGWNIGSFTDILQAGKGITHLIGETARAGTELITGRKPTWEAMSRQNRMSLEFYFGTVLVMAVFGAMAQKLLAGKWPTDSKDLMMPQTGAEMANGQPERLRLPTYMRDVLSLNHPIEMLKHKMNFPLRMFAALTENQDFFGEQIRDPFAPAGEQAIQTAQYVGKSLLPFGIQGFKSTEAPRAKALNLIGITKVPRLYSNTAAMNVIDEYNKQNRATMTSKEAAAEKRLKTELRGFAKAGDESGFKEAAATAISEGSLTRQQVKGIVDESQAPPGLGRFIALPVEWQVRVWNKANATEKEVWQPYLLKKVMAAKPEILIRSRETLVPVMQEMGLDDVADAIRDLTITEKGRRIDLTAMGIRKPEPVMAGMDQVDTVLAKAIKEHAEKMGEEKVKKPSLTLAKEKKRPYSVLGIQ